MKKFYGEKKWYETLYHWVIEKEEIEWRNESGENYNKNLKPNDTEFYLLYPPFHESDKNSNMYFDAWLYGFDDTNGFIVDTEEFNWYKKNRI